MKTHCKRFLPALLALLAVLLLVASCGGKEDAPTASTEAPYTGDLGQLASDFTGTLPANGIYNDTQPPTIP
ncbi:MAG: hypothetical protein LBS96_09080 [Oscillospiraceae bacterium]|nr:hypothetical protein [Oscillospiraceae bacterium]